MSGALVVCLLLGIVAGVFLARMLGGGGFRTVRVSEGEELLRDRALFLLDVRTKGEYRLGRIPGATLVPIAELEAGLARVPADRPVLVYCASGLRSRLAASRLAKRAGQHPVYNLAGGINAWQRAGLPVER